MNAPHTIRVLGRVTQTTFPSTRSEAYGYDALGNLCSKTDRKNQTIQYVYDALNRVTHKGYPDSTGRRIRLRLGQYGLESSPLQCLTL